MHFPDMTAAGALILLPFEIVGLCLALLGLRRHRPQPRGLWWGFTGTIVLLGMADVVALSGSSLATALYVTSYIAAVGNMARLVRLRAPDDPDAVLDAVFYAVVTFGALWLLTVPPDLSGMGATAPALRLIFTLLHAVAMFFAIRLLLHGARPDFTAVGLNLALLLVAVADVGATMAGDGWYDAPWIVLFGALRVALGAALFAPSVATAAHRRPVTGPLGRGRAVAQGATMMALAIPLVAFAVLQRSVYMMVWPPLVVVIGLVTTSRILRLIGWQRSAERRLRHAADVDALTALGNRRSLMAHVRRKLDHGAVDARVALLFIDLDNFKHVNDTLGHQTGDALLRAFSERLLGALRPGDRLFRFGGDEFAVLADVDTEREATALAERLHTVTSHPVSIGGIPLSVGASIGVRMSRPGDTADRLLSDADAAMYAAKADGRGRVRRFSGTAVSATVPDLELAGRLNAAIAESQMVLHYQPVWWLDSGAVAGAEALVRWRHPERGLLPPKDFLPIAGNIGALDALGAWVRQTAFADMAAALHAGTVPSGAQIGVNLAGPELLNDGIVDDIVAAVDAASLAPRDVVLEVTRNAFIDDSRARAALRALRSAGLRISLDDFGTGWASLDALASLPLTAVKLERQLLEHAVVEQRARQILATVVRMTNDLGLVAVAEGVEHEAHLELLLEVGCALGQGFLIGRPTPGLDDAMAAHPGQVLRRGRARGDTSGAVVHELRAFRADGGSAGATG